MSKLITLKQALYKKYELLQSLKTKYKIITIDTSKYNTIKEINSEINKIIQNNMGNNILIKEKNDRNAIQYKGFYNETQYVSMLIVTENMRKFGFVKKQNGYTAVLDEDDQSSIEWQDIGEEYTDTLLQNIASMYGSTLNKKKKKHSNEIEYEITN